MKNILTLALLLLSFVGWGQCDVTIVPGSITTTDENPGIIFTFDIINNTSTIISDYETELYLQWALNGWNSSPVWEFTINDDLLPGTPYTIETPKFDIPTPANASEWIYYTNWAGSTYYPFPGFPSARLGFGDPYNCAESIGIITPNNPSYNPGINGGDWNDFLNNQWLYYIEDWLTDPVLDNCINLDGDQFCDLNCDIGLNYLDPFGFEVGVLGDECYDLEIYPPTPGINVFVTNLSFGGPPPCGNINYLGFPTLYEGDTQYFDFYTYGIGNLPCADTIPIAFEEDCKVQLGISNPNQLSGLDINSSNNSIFVGTNLDCEFVETTPDIGLDSLTYQLGGCFGEPLYWIPEINITNYGDEVVTELCIEFDIWNVAGVEPDTICFDNLNILPGQSYILELPQNFNGGDDLLLISTELLSSNGIPEVFDPNNTMSNQFIMWCYDCIDPEADNYNPYATNPNDPDNCEYLGCTDQAADNFDSNANVDDGSCIYLGCTDPNANNYDPFATEDDGSCTFLGCTDENAINYDPEANVDDGSCEYNIYGCTDFEALNYNPDATIDDGSCTYAIPGCTDPSALNFDPEANEDDGSCEYNVFGCTDEDALNFDPNATADDGSCEYPSQPDLCDDIEVLAPNTFTPNNDGLNDAWYVETDKECWREWHVQIFNRWGSLVWESFDPDDVWTGSNNGSGYFVADGVYVYVIIGHKWNTDVISTSGHLTIFR